MFISAVRESCRLILAFLEFFLILSAQLIIFHPDLIGEQFIKEIKLVRIIEAVIFLRCICIFFLGFIIKTLFFRRNVIGIIIFYGRLVFFIIIFIIIEFLLVFLDFLFILLITLYDIAREFIFIAELFNLLASLIILIRRRHLLLESFLFFLYGLCLLIVIFRIIFIFIGSVVIEKVVILIPFFLGFLFRINKGFEFTGLRHLKLPENRGIESLSFVACFR